MDDDADAFWSTPEGYYLQLMTALTDAPRVAASLRSWSAAAKTPALQQAQQEMEKATRPWLERTLAAGQLVAAVRSDVPSGLLIKVVTCMGQAKDTWLITQQPNHTALPHQIRFSWA